MNKKRYLRGIDWIVHTFHHMTERATGVGNLSQIVLELEGALPPDRLAVALDRVVADLPLLAGVPARGWDLCPYWRVPRSARATDAFEMTSGTRPAGAGMADAARALAGNVNTGFTRPSCHLKFQLLYAGDLRSFLGMTFDHRLLDARGAESFLELLGAYADCGATPESAASIAVTEPSHLNRWADKFRAGRQVNRALLHLSQRTPVTYALPPDTARPFVFEVFSFTEAESSRISEDANRKAGYLMFMPYLLSVTLRAFHEVTVARGTADGNDYVVPVSIDARAAGSRLTELFFNHPTFLFFAVTRQEVESPELLCKSLAAQLYEQKKSGLPQCIEAASCLTRIAPLGLMQRMVRLPLRGKIGSFCFTCVGGTSFASTLFMGLRIRNVFHLPRVPVPPAIGLFFSQHQGRLNGVFSCLEGQMAPENVRLLLRRVREMLVPDAAGGA